MHIESNSSSLHEQFDESRFYLSVEDGSLGLADNVDGAINKALTSDGSVKMTVKTYIRTLKESLMESGFYFVESESECNVIAELNIKSVRYDPFGGWITDDMWINYYSNPEKVLLGKVTAKEQLVTPKIEDVIWNIYEGSLIMWGVQ